MRYRESGVNIDKASEAKKAIARAVRVTWSENVLSEIGQFGGLYRLPQGYRDPVLVSSVDGVGTKVLVARRARRYDTVGRDLVNHCVNDILVQGAKPLFFLDYIASGELEAEVVGEIVKGLSAACAENGCALIGGETAEMPGLYQGSDFDLAGSIVGVVEREAIIDGSRIEPGDLVFALPSTGLHTNGYSLARRLLFEELGLSVGDRVEEFGCTVADELLKVHRSYLAPVQEFQGLVAIKGLAHITGGGVVDNLPRILPAGCAAAIHTGSWPILPVFHFIQTKGSVSDAEMYRVFNMGLGMLIIVGADDERRVPSRLGELEVYRVGEIVKGDRTVGVV